MKKLTAAYNSFFHYTMDSLRYMRIKDISNYNLHYANASLVHVNNRLDEMNSERYHGNISKDLLLNIHLAVDEKHLLEMRITQLLNNQLDEYHLNSHPTANHWNKKEACKKLREAINRKTVNIPLDKLFSLLFSSMLDIPVENTLNVMLTLANLLEDNGYTPKVTRSHS